MPSDEMVNVRYMVDDVDDSVAFYTKQLGFNLLISARPPSRTSSGAIFVCSSRARARRGVRCPTAATPGPGGWNRIHFIVDDIDCRSRTAARRGGRSATTS